MSCPQAFGQCCHRMSDPSLRAPAQLSQALLRQAAHARCGLLLAPQRALTQACDVAGLHNWAVPADAAEPWQSVSGAVAWQAAAAEAGAIAEGLERLAAAQVPLALQTRDQLLASGAAVLDETQFALFSQAQRAAPRAIWPVPQQGDDLFAQVHRLRFGEAPSSLWVPQELVGLGPREGVARMPSTSSGLAAHRDSVHGPWLALLRAAQELLERDAFAVTWLHGLGGRELPVPARWAERAQALGGTLRAFDLTQAWNPHPVIAMLGGAPMEGAPRWVLGLACRATLDAAFEKAALEWAQSLAFAGFMLRERAQQLPRQAADLRNFDEHAAFYSLRPELWADMPLLAHARPAVLNDGSPKYCLEHQQKLAASLDTVAEKTNAAHTNNSAQGVQDHDVQAAQTLQGDVTSDAHRQVNADLRVAKPQLQALTQQLHGAGIELLYRELTTRDVAAAGLRVMRVLSPQLAQLHADERAPFLGRRTPDWRWRYPQGEPHGDFPNPMPHPLG